MDGNKLILFQYFNNIVHIHILKINYLFFIYLVFI